jgi:hypothetical protein
MLFFLSWKSLNAGFISQNSCVLINILAYFQYRIWILFGEEFTSDTKRSAKIRKFIQEISTAFKA